MTNITPDQPGDALRRRYQAQARSGKCADCGAVCDKSNLTEIKADGRRVCGTCLGTILLDAFRAANL